MSEPGSEPADTPEQRAAARRLEIIRRSQEQMSGTNVERIRHVYAPSRSSSAPSPPTPEHVTVSRAEVRAVRASVEAATSETGTVIRLQEIIREWPGTGPGSVVLEREQVAAAVGAGAELLAAAPPSDSDDDATPYQQLLRAQLVEALQLAPTVGYRQAATAMDGVAAALVAGTDPALGAGAGVLRLVRLGVELARSLGEPLP